MKRVKAGPVSVSYAVTFLFTAFNAPVYDPDVLNIAKANQTGGAMRRHVSHFGSYFLYGSQS